ncbi:MAG: LacI family DNA-binding transcriptional regulator [Bacteroidales bacterium]|nr:LacI family DNA-binding transcriptional regulator [Bacteroidales bacterium]
MESNQKITIKDIARLTGLSKGTVDRVLHNREGVSKKSYTKVMQVIQDLGYEPNLFASLLAQHKKHIIAVLLPNFVEGEFWELAEPGLRKGAEAVHAFGIEVRRVGYDQYNLDSFHKATEEVLALNPSGVVLAPMFKDDSFLFVRMLQERNIPYVYIDTKLDCGGYLAYFGMPLYQSGYLCAAILTDAREDVKEVAAVRVQRDKHGQSDPTIYRREGFIDYVSKHFPSCKMRSVFIDPKKPEEIDGMLEEFFDLHPEVRHIAMYNSRIYLVTPFLQRHPERNYRVVGFDNLAANLSGLKEGTVTALIAQRPDEQLHNAISTLSDFIVFGKAPAKRDNFVSMDILTRYNEEYY